MMASLPRAQRLASVLSGLRKRGFAVVNASNEPSVSVDPSSAGFGDISWPFAATPGRCISLIRVESDVARPVAPAAGTLALPERPRCISERWGPDERTPVWRLSTADRLIGHNGQLRVCARYRDSAHRCGELNHECNEMLDIPLVPGDSVLMFDDIAWSRHPNFEIDETIIAGTPLTVHWPIERLIRRRHFVGHSCGSVTKPPRTPSIASRGYGVTTVFDELTLDRIREALDRVPASGSTGHYVSVRDDAGLVAAALDAELREAIADPLSKRFPGWEIVFCSVTSKWPRPDSAVLFHHDLTITDERRARSLLVWCPIVDSDDTNGTLAVVPGSHRWWSGIRTRRPVSAVTALEGFQDRLAARAQSMPIRAGDAIYFDPALIHGSAPNESDAPRLAITVSMVPAGSELFHFFEDANGEVTGLSVTSEFYTTFEFAKWPDGLVRVEPWAKPVRAAEIDQALAMAESAQTGENAAFGGEP